MRDSDKEFFYKKLQQIIMNTSTIENNTITNSEQLSQSVLDLCKKFFKYGDRHELYSFIHQSYLPGNCWTTDLDFVERRDVYNNWTAIWVAVTEIISTELEELDPETTPKNYSLYDREHKFKTLLYTQFIDMIKRIPFSEKKPINECTMVFAIWMNRTGSEYLILDFKEPNREPILLPSKLYWYELIGKLDRWYKEGKSLHDIYETIKKEMIA